jgi:hypothetical protein
VDAGGQQMSACQEVILRWTTMSDRMQVTMIQTMIQGTVEFVMRASDALFRLSMYVSENVVPITGLCSREATKRPT